MTFRSSTRGRPMWPVGRQEGLDPLPLLVRKFSSRHAASIATESILVKLLLASGFIPDGRKGGSAVGGPSVRWFGEKAVADKLRRCRTAETWVLFQATFSLRLGGEMQYLGCALRWSWDELLTIAALRNAYGSEVLLPCD